MPGSWYRLLHQFCTELYFSRVTVLNRGALPDSGPTLYVGLHCNGAIDGLVYRHVVPRAEFMISTQLRRNLLGKLFFDGIEVVRSKDAGNPRANAAALEQCCALLERGGELFVFPEGTSTLGPRHLPFKTGAARIAWNCVQRGRGPRLRIVPMGVRYECAWAFRSRVEVLVGDDISIAGLDGMESQAAISELHARITRALEHVGINVESDAMLRQLQQLAYIATLGTPRSYYRTLKRLERGVPDPILRAWAQLAPRLTTSRLLRHQDVPLFPDGPIILYTFAFLLLAPWVALGLWINLPPLLAGWFASRRLADGRNVVSLWKILVGIPCFILWVPMMQALCFRLGGLWACGLYTALTVVALAGYYRMKKLAVTIINGLLHPGLRREVLRFRRTVLEALETST